MKFTQEQKEILDKIVDNRTLRGIKSDIGSGCHRLINLNEKYAIFRPCFGKGNIRYWFDFDEEFDDIVLYYILKSNGIGHHYSINREIEVLPREKERARMDKKEAKRKVEGFVKAFGRCHISDLLDYLETDVPTIIEITEGLKEEKILEEKCEKENIGKGRGGEIYLDMVDAKWGIV